MAAFGSQEWVAAKLKGSMHSFWDIPETALLKYNSIDPADRLPWNARTIANVINSYMINEAQNVFGSAQFLKEHGTTYQVMSDCALWYKQLNSSGLPSNYPTPTALDLMQGSFPFAPQLLLLVVGFRFDHSMQKVERVELQRFNNVGRMKYWIGIEKVTADVISIAPDQPRRKTRVAVRFGPDQSEIAVGD
jgi:hypothetical protein